MLGANHIPDFGGGSNQTSASNFTQTYYYSDGSDLEDLLNSTQYYQDGDLVTAEESEQEEFVCAFYNPDFIIYSSLGSFYIPCFLMLYLYCRIFKVRIKDSILIKWLKA